MSKIEKFRKGGFKWLFHSIGVRIKFKLNNYYYYHYQKLPIQDNLIVMESEGDLSDNAYALYDYMKTNGFLEKYNVVWLVDDLKAASKNKWLNTTFVTKNLYKTIDQERDKALATCKWYIYDHNNVFAGLVKRQGQMIFNLWHGVGYKGVKGEPILEKTSFDYFDTLSDKISVYCQAKFFGCSKDKGKALGYPRLDYLFNSQKLGSDFIKKLGISSKNKVILWMPTFRKSKSVALSEQYEFSNTGLPILYTEQSLKRFDEYLTSNNITILLKVHHLQADLPVFKKKFNNIIIIKDEQIKKAGLQLYQFIAGTDGLITDYSSIAIDYLLMDKPIIFTLDDYEEYDKSRGFIIDNAKDYMPGHHVYNYDDLIKALDDVSNNKDYYKSDRAKILPLYHKYSDGNSSARVLNFLKIEK